MKTLKVLLQEVVSGIKAWVNSNFAQESNAVHKTGVETITGNKIFNNDVRNLAIYDQLQPTAFDVRTNPTATIRKDIFRVWDGIPSSMGNYLGGIAYNQNTDGSSLLQLICFGYPTTGDAYQRRINFHPNRDGSCSFYPVNNNLVDLGTSSSQWNKLYSKEYYYNGTAWGLDKSNTWTGINTFVGNVGLVTYKSNEIDLAQHTDSNHRYVTQVVQDKNGKKIGECYWGYKASADESVASFWVTASDGLDSDLTHRGGIFILHHGSTGITDVHPSHLNGTNLGTSIHKWKTLNGINPGALSLPNLTKDTYDPTNGWYGLDTTDWDLTGSPIDISSSILKDGYVYVCLACDSTGYVVICEGVFTYPNCYFSTSGLPVSGYARALLPVRKGTDVRLYLKGTSVYSARLFPALGNV